MTNKKEKILVLRYRFIGDTLLTVPFLRNLRKNNPDAQIDMLIAPISGDVIKDCPYVDNFIYFDTTGKFRYENTQEPKKNFWNYVKLLKEKKYDKAYVLKRSFSSAALAFFAGIKHRIGFNTEGRGFLLTKRVPYSKDKHEVECFLDILRVDNQNIEDNYLEAWLQPDDLTKVQATINQYGINDIKKVVVHATSGNRQKEWDKEYFASVVDFISNNKEAQVIFLGAKGDKNTYDEILSLIKTPLKITPLNLCGEFTINESMAFLSKADLIVGCDSGNLHIAAAVGTPVIGIYGPMNSNKWKAWGDNVTVLKSFLPCVPCSLKKKCKKDRLCLKEITPNIVNEHIDRILK